MTSLFRTGKEESKLIESLLHVIDRSKVVLLSYAYKNHPEGRKLIKKDIKNGNDGISFLRKGKKMKKKQVDAFVKMLNQLIGFCNEMKDSPHMKTDDLLQCCMLTLIQLNTL